MTDFIQKTVRNAVLREHIYVATIATVSGIQQKFEIDNSLRNH